MKIIKIFPLLVLALALMACSLSVNVPTVRTGVAQTQEINEPAISETGTNKIAIEMGAGTLHLASGASNLIEGTIRYNVTSWQPNIIRDSERILFTQKNTEDIGVPDGTIVNDWDFKLGTFPIDLTLTTGAYDGDLDLSGLAITNLTISDGASKSRIHFDSPNLVEMEKLTYKTGASDIELIGLANANVHEVNFDGGVGSYTLDFTGELKRDINARIQTGMSDMTIIVPASTHTVITIGDGISNINVNGTWTTTGTSYECGSSNSTIYINIGMAVGNLTLTQK